MNKINQPLIAVMFASSVLSQTSASTENLSDMPQIRFIDRFSSHKIDTEAKPFHEKISIIDGDVDLDEYGGVVSIGIALGGGGIAGVPIRVYLMPKIVVEAGVYYRPFLLVTKTQTVYSEETTIDFFHGAMLAGGLIFYPKKVHRYDFVRLNGICLKTGHSFSEVPETMMALGWAMEKINDRSKKRSFSIEIGAGVNILHDNIYANDYQLTGTNIGPLIYWKFQWGWFAG